MGLSSLVGLVFVLSVLFSSLSYGVEYYRYTDERGITVINRLGVPPHLIGQGYEVLSEQGNVVRVVPRAPTPEEYRQMQAQKEQAESDRQLLLLYSQMEDIDRARDRKLADVEGQISIAQSNLLTINGLQTELREQAASQERAGHEVSMFLLKQIEQADLDERRLQKRIAHYIEAKQAVKSTFARDRTRFEKLLKQKKVPLNN